MTLVSAEVGKHHSYHVFCQPRCLSEGGQETTARLRLVLLHPTVDVALAFVDSYRFVIMSRNLPTPARLEVYLPQWDLASDQVCLAMAYNSSVLLLLFSLLSLLLLLLFIFFLTRSFILLLLSLLSLLLLLFIYLFSTHSSIVALFLSVTIRFYQRDFFGFWFSFMLFVYCAAVITQSILSVYPDPKLPRP